MGRSTLNSALKKLEREGILTLSPGSGRHTCVSLTAQGHRLADRTVCRLIRLEDRIYAGWTSEEQALLLRLNRDFTEAGGHRGVFVMGHPQIKDTAGGLSCRWLTLPHDLADLGVAGSLRLVGDINTW